MLAPYVRVGVQDGRLFLGFGSIQRVFDDPSLWGPLIRLVDYYSVPRTYDEATGFLERECGLSPERAEELLGVLRGGCYLIPAGSYRPEDRYSRPTLFHGLWGADPQEVQERLAGSHVVFLGCGGIGNLMSVALATAGVGRVTLVDADHIEKSNLTRQYLFTETDVGAAKCEILARELRARNSDTEVCTIRRRITNRADLDVLPQADLLVLSADSTGITELVNTHCVTTETAWLNVCYVNDIAVWGPLVIPGQTGCWSCHQLTARDSSGSAELDALISRINRRYQAPSHGSTNMLSSALASLDALKYLGGFGAVQSLGRRVGVWTHQLRLDEQPSTPNPDCPTCGPLRA
ncbi:TOMM precursor leader peptide-binding protein [Thermobifida halotolerans]|uniref:TOMM leader peptide-binding protein n=2 Tax=Thermobifida halotolerans TaxID=483545 RepID=A0AA97M0T0_9ACTN|nr:TOMM precursor leader peptide-binding protein [Thermobifida halotolerans]UOE21694.1 TOMM precursor leader peptide-binding protein [Thermobifida halotolerans]